MYVKSFYPKSETLSFGKKVNLELLPANRMFPSARFSVRFLEWLKKGEVVSTFITRNSSSVVCCFFPHAFVINYKPFFCNRALNCAHAQVHIIIIKWYLVKMVY